MIKSLGLKGKPLAFRQLKSFSNSTPIKINKYLQERLSACKLLPLKDFQIETFETVADENKNCFVNSCTGSGKTLAYLLPILNNILLQKEALSKEKQKQNGTPLDQIRQRSIQYEKNQRHGALIFTLNKQLSLQIYKQIRLLDTQSRINVYRIGPISHFSPVVQLLNKKHKTPEQQDQIADGVERNIVRCVNWMKTDILISTPQTFYNIMTQMVHNKHNAINPKFIAIDEADLLLQIDQNLAKSMNKIIAMVRSQKRSIKGVKNFFSQQKGQDESEIQFLMSSSSFPRKIDKIPYEQYMRANFEPMKTVTGINKHRLPQRLQLKYIQIEAISTDSPGQQNQQLHNQKLYFLAKILTDPQKKGNRFIIFCSNKKTVQRVCAFLNQKLKLPSIQYYANLPSDQRSLNLYKFNNQHFDILVSTDLGSRGLDFARPIHTVIEYDLSENIVNFINRAGRTARNQLPGQIISFVEEKNKIFFQHLAQKNSNQQEFDQLFSRKRSYNKLILKHMKQEQKI